MSGRRIAGGMFVVVALLWPCCVYAENSPDDLMVWDRNRPIADWLAELDSDQPHVHEKATSVCHQVCRAITAVSLRQRMHPNALDISELGDWFSGDDRISSEDQEAVSRWRNELVVLIPQILDRIDRVSGHEWGMLFFMLVVADTDGAVLRKERHRLLTSSKKRWAALSVLGQGAYIFPRDRSVLALVAEDLKTLSPSERKYLDQLWVTMTRKDVPPDPESAGVGIMVGYLGMMLCVLDRIQCELPQVAVLMSKDYPTLVRVLALSCVAELGEEAHPILPSIEQQLDDPDSHIRLATGTAIVATIPGTVDLDELTKRLELPAEQQAEFLKSSQSIVRQTKEIESMSTSDSDESMNKLCLMLLRSHHQFFIRQGLRELILMKSAALYAQKDVLAVLQLSDLDDETLRLAKLALAAIEEK